MKLNFVLIKCIAICAMQIPAFSQNGPGGVGNTYASSSLKLWLNASSVDNIFSGNNIGSWQDLSGNDNHATQASSASKPNLIKNLVNGQSGIRFNGNSEYFTGTLGPAFNAPATFISVGYFANANQANDNNDYLFSLGTINLPGGEMSFARRKQNDGPNADKYFSIENIGQIRFAPVLPGQAWLMSTQSYASIAPLHTVKINNSNQVLESDYSVSLATDGIYSIGNWADASITSSEFLMDGYISEIIAFNRLLKIAEMNIISAYLAGKYNISIASDIYAGDDLANGNHDLDIIGVGVDADGLHGNSEQSGLKIIIDSNFESGDYVVAGHNVQQNIVNTSDIGGGMLEARWERVWWIDVTDMGPAIKLDFVFDASNAGLGASLNNASNYKLIYRSGTSGNWSILPDVAMIQGDQIHFDGVDLSATGDGQYAVGTTNSTLSPLGQIPIGETCDGPGGVGSTNGAPPLKLWLDANSIEGSNSDLVVNWGDKSGNNFDALSNPTSISKLNLGNVNGMNSILFDIADGNQDYYSGSLGNLDAPATIIAIPNFSQVNQGDLDVDNDYLISIGTNGTANQHTSISRRLPGANVNQYYAWDGQAARLGPVIVGQSWNILTQYHNSVAAWHQFYLNGSLSAATDFTSSLNTDGSFEIGRWDAGGNYFLGDIAEIIIYDKALNLAERNIVHSYLAAKYDLIVAGDKYQGDDNANGDYDFDVAGVGIEAVGLNASACSAGLSISIDNNFGNGDYALIGHSVDVNAVNIIDIASDIGTVEGRWERDWYIDITDAGPGLTLDLIFDYTSSGLYGFSGGDPTNYKLLYRAGTSGAWSSIADANSIAGDQVYFNSIPLVADGYITIGTINLLDSPLPVELTSFKGNVNNSQIELQWEVASEYNIDRYEVQRATNPEFFQTFDQVAAQGNDGNQRTYKVVDQNFTSKTNYYRLKIIEADGTFKFSNIIHVSIDNLKPIIYPNPTGDKLSFLIPSEKESCTVLIRDLMGGVHHNSIYNLETRLDIDVSDLSSGIYIAEILLDDQVHRIRFLKL